MAIGESSVRDESQLVIKRATIIDGIADSPVQGKTIWVRDGRIQAIGTSEELGFMPSGKVIDAGGKYVIPGLMNANVHLLLPVSLERLARHMGQYEELVVEAAQVALKAGLTTVFDTWGPRRVLVNVREQINAGKIPGSRIFCAGNIIGFEGPCSVDFSAKFGEVASAQFVGRVNSLWVENVGRHLMWLTPDGVAQEVRRYMARGIDFVKYASNEHGSQAAGAFIQFSPRVQEVIVAEAHRAGLTAQAHCTSVEGLRIALEAGCELIQHCNITGPTVIPEETLRIFERGRVGAVVFPFSRRRLQWMFDKAPGQSAGVDWALAQTMYRASDANVRSLIQSGALLMLANDAGVWPSELVTDECYSRNLGPDGDKFLDLSEGHFEWLEAMEEKGCGPMQMLRAATRNIAIAYGKEKELGSIEVGKIADLIILDKNPLAAAKNYRSIHAIVKDGVLVDLAGLPSSPILTKGMEPAAGDDSSYVPFIRGGALPSCPSCMYNLRRP